MFRFTVWGGFRFLRTGDDLGKLRGIDIAVVFIFEIRHDQPRIGARMVVEHGHGQFGIQVVIVHEHALQHHRSHVGEHILLELRQIPEIGVIGIAQPEIPAVLNLMLEPHHHLHGQQGHREVAHIVAQMPEQAHTLLEFLAIAPFKAHRDLRTHCRTHQRHREILQIQRILP